MRKFISKRNITVLVILLAIGGVVWFRNQSRSKSAGEVKTATVSRGQVKEVITVSGDIKADKEAILNFQATGKVAYAGVKSGDSVKKYQLLASLDTGELDNAARAAYYQYLAAEANAKEVEDSAKNHERDENFDLRNTRITAQTSRDIAYDAWQQAIKNVQKANLYAPFDGYVTATTIRAAGDTAGITDGVTVVAPEGMHFEGEIDETDVTRVKIGQKVEVKLDAFEDKIFEGTISIIGFASRLSSTGANVYPVVITFKPEDEKELRLGMNGDADIVISVAENTLKLPIEAVVDDEVTLTGEKKEKRKVKLGIEGENEVEIKEGLQEGETVVIK